MKRIFKEPLFHFLLIGVAIYVAYSFMPSNDVVSRDAIVVSAGKIEHLKTLFTRTWQRQPTRTELEGLVKDYLREEVAYREGIAMGLDRDDTIIRRRIRQKLEFIAKDIAIQNEPSDDQLTEYLAAHADQFRVDPRMTFKQIYLNADQRRESLETDTRNLLVAFNSDPSIDASTLGDRILLEHEYTDVSMQEIASLFGQQFAAAVVKLEPGTWGGPVESGYGIHLVFVDEHSEARLPELGEVRNLVLREWEHTRSQETTDTFFNNMINQYEVVIEWADYDTDKDES